MTTSKMPLPKLFDTSKHKETFDNLSRYMGEVLFENACSLIAIDILKIHEGFEHVELGPNFHGTPFDFFGFKDGRPYIIELNASLDHFNTPGEGQKKRMRKVLKAVKGLNIAFLQLKLSTRQYRIFYNDEMDVLFTGKRVSLKPVIDWVRNKCES